MDYRADSKRLVETPEGNLLSLPLAGLAPRIGAWLLDFMLRSILVISVSLGASVFGKSGDGIWLIAFFGVTWLYTILFEALNDGQTPGKKSVNIRVVMADGTPLSFGASVLRNLLRVVDGFPVGYAPGILSILFSKDFQRLGDWVGNTIVIRVPNGGRETDIVHNDTVVPRRSKVALSYDEQAAVIALSKRRHLLGEARTEEIASIVAEHLVPKSDARPADKLLSVARWCRGDRP